jgi:ubiquinone/menaquinone biosynthesis C-methylase UbiE
MQVMTSPTDNSTPALVHVTAGQVSCDDTWEAAYKRFETADEEVAKFRTRLRWFGAHEWPRDLSIVELFCGRGNAMVAWRHLGFTRLEGVDLSDTLLAEYKGPARCYVADCRELPFEDNSRDVLAVHGGLHHLPELLTDLERAIDECHRVLKPGGRLLIVEPWNTLFLKFVHWAAANPLARRSSDKLDAFQQLYLHERETYDRWRNNPEVILEVLCSRFQTERLSERWGKLYFLGRKGE